MLSRRRLIRASALAAPWIFLPRWANSSIHGSIATGLTINVTTDPSNTGTRGSPGTAFGGSSAQINAFFNGVDTMKQTFEARFCKSTKTTVNVQIDFANYFPFGIPEVVAGRGQNTSNTGSTLNDNGPQGYLTYKTALVSKALDSEALSFANSWPVSNPGSGFGFSTHNCLLRQLGLAQYSSSFPNIDGWIGVSSNPTPGVFMHELSEVMGRVGGRGGGGSPIDVFLPLDCMSFSAVGVREVITNSAVADYLSANNGTTNGYAGGILASMNTTTAVGDLGDWLDSMDANDCCNANGGPNWTERDDRTMNILGWQWNGTI